MIRHTWRSAGARTLARRGAVVLSVIIGLGTGWQSLSERSGILATRMPGRLIDVAGVATHLDCHGSGSPTIVFENGAGDHALAWGPVARVVAAAHRACRHDRPGTGWSAPHSGRERAASVAEDLHLLLRSAGERPPYVIVGHSLGGLFARAFAARYPDDVVGLVLVESSEPEMYAGAGRFAREGDLAGGALDVLSTTVGVERLIARAGPDARYLSGEREAAAALDLRTTASMRGFREMLALPASARDLATLGALRPDLPVAVVSRALPSRPSPGALAWRDAQNRLAALTRVSRHWIAHGRGHRPQLDEPALVADAIRWVIGATGRQP